MSFHTNRVAEPSSRIEAGAAGYLRDVDRAGWAWEWLRRNPAYRAVAPSSGIAVAAGAPSIIRNDAITRVASPWGLHFR